jgi:1-phosphofructokinase family hexose kinase
MTKLLSITPNAALDRTVTVDRLSVGMIHRATSTLNAAGGKGINVARAARTLGAEVTCGGLLAGMTGQMVARLAEAEGLNAAWTWLDEGETRACTIIVDQESATVINEQGPYVYEADWAHLTSSALTAARNADAVCICGSLPPGVTGAMCADLLRDLIAAGHPVWLDSSGAALEAALSVAGVHIKVNDDEIAGLFNQAIRDERDAAAAAVEAQRVTGSSVIVTMGAKGAVLVERDGVFFCEPPHVNALSAVGSGDSFFAGLLVSLYDHLPPLETLRRACAAGAANALSIGGGHFTLTEFNRMLPLIKGQTLS